MAPTSDPERIGRFRVRRRLGGGGMGVVYLAVDPDLEREVAIKVIKPQTDDDHLAAQLVARLSQEARMIARLRHPRIVTIHEYNEHDGELFLVMELLDGQSLDKAIAARSLGHVEKVAVLDQMLEGLEYAHRHGVIHRDVKPANVQLLGDGSVKLLDFGLARVLGHESFVQITEAGAIPGTPAYMSPEQIDQRELDARTDVFSAGSLAYELFTGRKPFQGPTLSSLCWQIVNVDPAPMVEAWPDADPAIERVVRMAMTKAVEDRYADAGAMRADLLAQLAGPRATPVGDAQPRGTLHSAPTLRDASNAPAPPTPPAPGVRPLASDGASWRRHRASWATIGAAAVAVLLAVSMYALSFTSEAGEDAPAARIAGGTPQGDSRSNGQAPVTPPPTPPPSTVPAPGPDKTTVAPTAPRTGTARSGVSVGKVTGDPFLADHVRAALEANGLAPAPSTTARIAIDVDLQIVLRPEAASLGAGSRTADYAGTLRLRDRVTATERRVPLTGQGLDFSEPAARQAAARRAAEAIAGHVEAALRP